MNYEQLVDLRAEEILFEVEMMAAAALTEINANLDRAEEALMINYLLMEPDPYPVHEVVGICADCGDPAHVMLEGTPFCFPDAYNRAN